MKKVSLLFALFGIFSAMTVAQYRFPTRNTLWKIDDISTRRDAASRSISYKGVFFISCSDQGAFVNGKPYYSFREWPGGVCAEGRKVWITFNWKDELLLYDFGAKAGDTIVHGPVYKDFPKMDPVHSIREFAARDGFCFSVVRNVWQSDRRKQIDVDCFYAHSDTDSGEKEIMLLGSDTWYEGVGSRYGLFAGWAHMIPPEDGPGWSYRYGIRQVFYEGGDVYNYPVYTMQPYRGSYGGPGASYDDFSKSLYVSGREGELVTVQLLDLSEKLVSQAFLWRSGTVSFKEYTGGYLCKVLYEDRVCHAYRLRLD